MDFKIIKEFNYRGYKGKVSAVYIDQNEYKLTKDLHKNIIKVNDNKYIHHYNGYVKIPLNHKLYDVYYMNINNLSVHGGLTFSGKLEGSNDYLIGFDCAHYSDNPVKQNEAYVENEIKNLIDQIIDLYDKSNEYLEKVEHFMKISNQEVKENPEIPSVDICNLRISLIQEELDELGDAIREQNMTEILDALCDLQYVLSGTVHSFGLGNVFDKAFEEVNNSNMSKFCKTEDDAIISVQNYKKKGIDTHYKKVGDLYVIIRNSDNKILKGKYFKQPELKQFLDEKK